MQQTYHVPVLLREVLDLLSIKPHGVYIDGTLGGGGHFRAIADRLFDGGKIIGLDRDRQAIENFQKNGYHRNLVSIILEQSRFSDFDSILDKYAIGKVDGILLDLGVSSKQIDAAERGFSYMQDAALDMRMDQSQPLTARDLIYNSDEEQLSEILADYGEIRNSDRMAHTIKKYLKTNDLNTSADLKACIEGEYGSHVKIQVYAKLFQALRIAVNGELEQLTIFLSKALKFLSPGGRVAVISYHSLEDRIVKEFMRSAEEPCICPPDFPMCTCHKPVLLKRVTRKAVRAADEEIKANPRARSARLRVAERTEVPLK